MLLKKPATSYLLSGAITLLITFFAIKVISTSQLWIMAMPFVFLSGLLLLSYPSLFPFIFVSSAYFGIFLINGYRIGILLTDIIIYLYAAMFIISTNTRYRYNVNVFRHISIALYLFVIICIISFWINLSEIPGKYLLVSIWYMIKMFELPLAFLLFIRLSLNYEKCQKFIKLAIFLALLEFPVVLFQYFNANLEGFDALRAVHGTFTNHHSLLGTFMIIPFSLSTAMVFDVQDKKIKVLYFLFAIIILVMIILSGSRSALLGVMVAISLFIMYKFHFKIEYLKYILIILFLSIPLYLFTPLKDIFSVTFGFADTGQIDLSSISRLFIWSGAINHFKDAPLYQKIFGIGIGAYPTILYDVVLWGGSKSAIGAHNNPLHVLSEIGIVGLISFMYLFFTILKKLYIAGKNDILPMLYFFVTIAMLISGITQETFWFQKSFGNLWMFYMVFLVIVLRHAEIKETLE